MNTDKGQSELPPELETAVQTEAEAYGFDPAAAHWLRLLLLDDPTLPAPTAGAMVARARRLEVGEDLATIDETLARLDRRDTNEMGTSERRVTAMVLGDLMSRAGTLLTKIT